MPPKKEKKDKSDSRPKPPAVRWRDLPPAVRKNMTEFLQPTVQQQEKLGTTYERYAEQRNRVKFYETHPNLILVREQPGYIASERRWMETTKKWYNRDKEMYMQAPGIHETYSFFWDDDEPFPDQGPDPDMGGGDMLTT